MSGELDLTYEKAFAPRPDGRYVTTMAAQMAALRDWTPELALPETADPAVFAAWQRAVKERLRRQLHLPDPGPQPEPVLLSRVQREGYRAEKWEFCPDRYAAVPFLALIPDGASPGRPVPAVLCFPQSGDSKEFSAGEPELDHPNCRASSRQEEDRMALQVVQNGMAAFVFDNPGDGECSVWSDPGAGVTQEYLREVLCHGLLEMGLSYESVTVFQRLRFLELLGCFPWADPERIGLCAQGLGARAALETALLCERVKCLVFNDVLRDDRRSFSALTESHSVKLSNELEKWQVLPGRMRSWGDQDLCAALAPRYLALTEGGADELVDTVRRAYALCSARDRLLVSYYPAYADPAAHTRSGPIPSRGLDRRDADRWSYVDGADRCFRAAPAMALLRQCFGL